MMIIVARMIMNNKWVLHVNANENAKYALTTNIKIIEIIFFLICFFNF